MSRMPTVKPSPLIQQPPIQASPSPLNPSSFPEAERRQLTVLFCDLVGSTILSGQFELLVGANAAIRLVR